MLREGRGGGGGDLDEFFCRFDQEKRDRIVVFLLYGIGVSNCCDCCLTVVSGKYNRSNGQEIRRRDFSCCEQNGAKVFIVVRGSMSLYIAMQCIHFNYTISRKYNLIQSMII